MALTKEQYRAFEDVVGPEHISVDAVILHAYSFRSGLYASPESFSPLFEAVVLPSCVEEIQAIVRLCKRFNLRFKASSTGWGPYNDATSSGVIKIDLRRMNRILEINEKDMYAVVEPYVIGAQLQAELMKRGFISNLCGAGSNCSALPIAAHQGIGHLSQSASYGERNMLALEWVTPEGEIIRLGSLGHTGEWFSGDGPGPSLRGIVRGNVVPLGGLGIYTKAATKIYHWPGPKVFPIEGVSPDYAPLTLPDGFFIGFFSFPSLERLKEAQRMMGETEIAYELMGFNASMVASNIARSNDDYVRLFDEIKRETLGPCLLVIIAGNSKRDFEYKREVLWVIIGETGGRPIRRLMDDERLSASALWRWIRSTASIREVFRATGCFGGAVGCTDLFGLMADYIDRLGELKKDLIEKGLILDDETTPFTQSCEHGHFGHAELLIRYRPNPETFRVLLEEFLPKANEIAISGHYGVPAHVFGDKAHDLFGPSTSNYHLWLRRIKRALDPAGLSESSFYISATEEVTQGGPLKNEEERRRRR